ncbi:MAG: MBL fold metallo-hydrolase [Bacteroidales bacterium]
MRIEILKLGEFLADGGAVFGVVPKVLWSKRYPCDENNFCKMTFDSLYVETEDRKMIIDSGVGSNWDDKYLENNGVKNTVRVQDVLAEIGVGVDEITDVIFTHLHWDHCGGCVVEVGGHMELVFKNARHWTSETQYNNALNAHVREGSAINRKDFMAIMEVGQLELIKDDTEICKGVFLRQFHGHTPGMIIPILSSNGKKLAFAADLVPLYPSIPTAWVCAYDLFPLQSMKEKEAFLLEFAAEGGILFFEHDYYTKCGKVSIDLKKGARPGEVLDFAEVQKMFV